MKNQPANPCGQPLTRAALRTTTEMNFPHRMIHHLLIAWNLPRWRWALVTAVLSDMLGFGVVLWPPAQWLLDAITAAVLFAALGFRWPLLSALAIEVVPGLELFPAWTLVVVALASTESKTDPLGGGTPGQDSGSIKNNRPG